MWCKVGQVTTTPLAGSRPDGDPGVRGGGLCRVNPEEFRVALIICFET